jgi:hypothetical protein
MSTGRFSDYQVAQWLADAASNGYWLAIHYDDPDISGAYASEIFGGSYIRVLAQFSGVDGRTIWNTDTVRWTGLPAVQATFLAGWDAQFNGNLLWSSSIDGVVKFIDGSTWAIPAQSVALSIN